MFKELIEVIRRAESDAELAERMYQEREFRTELRTAPEVALAVFTIRPLATAPVRQIPAAWRLRTEPRRTRTAA
jgi:hypothetical protein